MGIWDANGTIISGNSITDHEGTGIQLHSDNCTIESNLISGNERGIIMSSGASYNIIIKNTLSNHSFRGIDVGSGTNACQIYHNNFINNAENAYDTTFNFGNNTWDNGYPSGGNFWDDYHGVDEDPEDGIGDTSYYIPPLGDEMDNYPLMEPWD
jgi:parallel beta-helix repeat protein